MNEHPERRPPTKEECLIELVDFLIAIADERDDTGISLGQLCDEAPALTERTRGFAHAPSSAS